MNYEICVVGHEAMLFPFLQFGFATFAPKSEAALRECLLDVIDRGYGIIYLEDSFCFLAKDIIESRRGSLTPIFVPIGGDDEGEGYFAQVAREMAEKAVGVNVL